MRSHKSVVMLMLAFALVAVLAAACIPEPVAPPQEEGGVDTGIDCGKNPYIWNPIGQHYQRRFITWCEQYTGDPNETLYDGLWLNETPLGD